MLSIPRRWGRPRCFAVCMSGEERSHPALPGDKRLAWGPRFIHSWQWSRINSLISVSNDDENIISMIITLWCSTLPWVAYQSSCLMSGQPHLGWSLYSPPAGSSISAEQQIDGWWSSVSVSRNHIIRTKVAKMHFIEHLTCQKKHCSWQ